MTFSLKLRSERAVWTYVLGETTVSLTVTHLALHYGIGHAAHLRYWPIATLICIVLGIVMGYFSAKMNARNTLLADELAHLASHDTLTGCFNRRHFFQTAKDPGHYPAAVILADLDRFKSVNDRFGHAGGDEALRHLSAVLQRGLGAGDTLARLGGEEFVVLLPGADEARAERVALTLLSALRKSPVILQAEQLLLTASFGVSEVADPAGIDQAVHQADLAMYQAKMNGRAQVCRFSDMAGTGWDETMRDVRTVVRPGGPERGAHPRVRQSPRGQTH